MKRMKKLLALALALALTLALPAFAEDDSTSPDLSTLPTPAGSDQPDTTVHEYEAYQIFSGTYDAASDGEDDDTLSTVAWGSGFGTETGKTVQAFISAFNTKYGQSVEYDVDYPDRSAKDVAKYISTFTTDSEAAQEFAYFVGNYMVNAEESMSVAAGYYWIKDVTETNVPDFVYNVSVLSMNAAGTITPTIKTNTVPGHDKDVWGKKADGSYGWVNVSDYAVGQNITYVLTAVLPDDFERYETYNLTFQDKLSEGLTLNTDSIKVYYGTNTTIDKSSDWTIKTGSEAGEYSLTVSNKTNMAENASFANKTIIRVVYTAQLNEKAQQNIANTNTFTLQFTNNPENGTSSGTTPKDEVKVYTFELDINKTQPGATEDAEHIALPGAGFTLYKLGDDDKYTVVETIGKADDKTTFKFKGLSAGSYKLEESEVPAGFNKADDMFFKIVPTYDENGTLTGLKAEWPTESKDNTITTNFANDKLTTEVVNYRGVLLPSTGGMGTTIFYVVGGLLIVGAGVLLITKKRMAEK